MSGKRLSRARKLYGFTSREKLSDVTLINGVFITAKRIGKLERDEASPTVAEVQALCSALDMSSDWWLRGDDVSPELILRRIKELSDDHRRALLLILDLIRHVK